MRFILLSIFFLLPKNWQWWWGQQLCRIRFESHPIQDQTTNTPPSTYTYLGAICVQLCTRHNKKKEEKKIQCDAIAYKHSNSISWERYVVRGTFRYRFGRKKNGSCL